MANLNKGGVSWYHFSLIIASLGIVIILCPLLGIAITLTLLRLFH